MCVFDLNVSVIDIRMLVCPKILLWQIYVPDNKEYTYIFV
jgi:hypothetical protein